MSAHVKVGQVWASKASGAQWEVMEQPKEEDGRRWWPLQRVERNGSKTLPEWMLLDDYVLVKDAP